VDVLASLLDTHGLTTVVCGRIDLTPPWRLESAPTDLFSILLQVSGQSHIEQKTLPEPLVINAGDILIRPRGKADGYMHDGSNPPTATWRLSVPAPGDRVPTPRPLRLARDPGHPVSSVVSCLLRMGDAPRGPLLDSLPELIHIPTGTTSRYTGLRQAADVMISEAASPGPASTRLMSRLAEILLILVLRQQADERSGHPGLRALNDPLIAPAIRHMHADPAYPWTVAALASACGLSRSAFADHFSEVVGISPGAYLTEWRMASATKLLATTYTTVDRVAASVGYRSEAAFRRAFTTALGCTPREYRTRTRSKALPRTDLRSRPVTAPSGPAGTGPATAPGPSPARCPAGNPP